MKTSDRRFVVYEGSSAFYLSDLVTGEEVCLGDGVDAIWNPVGEPIFAGSEGFLGKYQEMYDGIGEDEIEEMYPVFSEDQN